MSSLQGRIALRFCRSQKCGPPALAASCMCPQHKQCIAWHLQARARDKDLRGRETQLQAGKAGSSRSVSCSALEQREAALAEREAAMARASAAAEYARSEAETLWRSHKVWCLVQEPRKPMLSHLCPHERTFSIPVETQRACLLISEEASFSAGGGNAYCRAVARCRGVACKVDG